MSFVEYRHLRLIPEEAGMHVSWPIAMVVRLDGVTAAFRMVIARPVLV
jgi:hypothetical protein